jgi:deoxyribose-phosphate aldolase
VTPVKLIPLIDLTCLDEQATESTIEQLCAKAITPFGPVAAVCIYPQFISLARQGLAGSSVAIATVVNFPHGSDALKTVLTDIENAISSGATEIDVVIPYHFYLSQERTKVQTFLNACRKTCSVKLKTILETGALHSAELIAIASADAIDAGVDFIKTSTGKIPTGATPDAAAIMFASIKLVKNSSTGFKASGGIRHINQAMHYLELATTILGENWISPETFRFGASSLLDEITNPSHAYPQLS